MGNCIEEGSDNKKCVGGKHRRKQVYCMGSDCYKKPALCLNCCYKSKENTSILLCRLCKITEVNDQKGDDYSQDDITQKP